MPAVHPSVVVAHSVQVVHKVKGCQLVLLPGLIPAGLQAGLAGAVALVHHVRRHVQTGQGELHQRGELVPSLADLAEALQVEDEYVRECPQAHLHHALLQLLAVGALPRVVRRQLTRVGVGRETGEDSAWVCLLPKVTETTSIIWGTGLLIGSQFIHCIYAYIYIYAMN